MGDHLTVRQPYRDVRAALAGGVGYFLLAGGALLFSAHENNVSAIWPANAILLALIMQVDARRWPVYVATAFVGNFLANFLLFGGLVTPTLYATANMSEVVAAAVVLRLAKVDGNPLRDVRTVFRFAIFGCLLVPIFSSVNGAAIAHFQYATPFWAAYSTWYIADALGLLIFTPLFSGMISGEMSRWFRDLGHRGRIETVVILCGVAAAGCFTFLIVGYPILFVMTAPVILATFRLGQFGTKLSVIIVAVIGVICTMSGLGPIAGMIQGRGEQALFLQFYLAYMLLTTLPVSAELNARRALARRLVQSEASLRLLASESADALVRLDSDGQCIQASGATTMLLGIGTRDLVGNRLCTLVDGRDSAAVEAAIADALGQPGTVAYCEFRPRDRDGDWLECTLRALIDQDGQAYGAVGAIRDITIRKERELNLSVAASTDSLTGALNHAAFMARLDRELAHLTSSHLALIMVDIDHFKRVNDRHGHPAGDRVLVELCARLRALIRDHDVIGRLGGDEIAILLDGTAEELALSIAEAIRVAVSSRPILLHEDQPLAISISCGVAQAFPGITRDALLRKADEALYQAKGDGRDRVVISAL